MAFIDRITPGVRQTGPVNISQQAGPPPITQLPPPPDRPRVGSVSDGVFQPPIDTTPTDTFMLPENKYPYSGLPESYRDQLLQFVMPRIQDAYGNLDQNVVDYEQAAANAYTPINTQGTGIDLSGQFANIDLSTQQALLGYKQQLQNYLKEAIPGQVNQLANRGILSSSVASDTLSDVAAKGARDASARGYETLMQAAQQKAQLEQAAVLNQAGFAQDVAMRNAEQQNLQNFNAATQAAIMRNNIPTTLQGLLQYGQSSQDTSVMYQAMVDLLASV